MNVEIILVLFLVINSYVWVSKYLFVYLKHLVSLQKDCLKRTPDAKIVTIILQQYVIRWNMPLGHLQYVLKLPNIKISIDTARQLFVWVSLGVRKRTAGAIPSLCNYLYAWICERNFICMNSSAWRIYMYIYKFLYTVGFGLCVFIFLWPHVNI